jgi:hypothetical protein
MSAPLPGWAREMGDLFRTGAVAQFLIHGNVFDVVPGPDGRLLPLKVFLDEVMFESYDVVLHYDRGRGIRATKGAQDWEDFRQQALGAELLNPAQTREPGAALELIDRYLLFALNLKALRDRAKSAASESDRSSAFSAGFAAGLAAGGGGATPRAGGRASSSAGAAAAAPAAASSRASAPRKLDSSRYAPRPRAHFQHRVRRRSARASVRSLHRNSFTFLTFSCDPGLAQ